MRRILFGLIAGGVALGGLVSCRQRPVPDFPFAEVTPGLSYGNQIIADFPWSIHAVRVERSRADFCLQSVHARGGAVGLSRLSEQLQGMPADRGLPMAAVNGDFYQRDRTYAGDPRGLQISGGELLSGPVGGVGFWVDVDDRAWATNVSAHFQVTWLGGPNLVFGLNEERTPDAAVLYTPAVGGSTRTSGGVEWVLGPAGGGRWLPLPVDDVLKARIQAVREGGDSPLAPDVMVLSFGPALARKLPKLAVGTEVKLSTATSPVLAGTRTAISGGPVLVREGQRLKLPRPSSEAYEFRSMSERHPRTGIGWNSQYFYLVEVDGRQPRLSVGMTLAELADCFVSLGCTDAMNLDGGGSATLWCDGKVRNQPSEGVERPIANSLVVTRGAVDCGSPLRGGGASRPNPAR